MKWKWDENFGSRTAHLFLRAGHDVETVLQENLGGSTDEELFEACIRKGRALLTLDIDFADVLRFPPHRTSGEAVLRMPGNPSLQLMEILAGTLLQVFPAQPIEGRLWVVEPGRIRIHEETSSE